MSRTRSRLRPDPEDVGTHERVGSCTRSRPRTARRSGTLRNVLVSRRGRPFTDRERDLVRLATRHVAVAVRRLEAERVVGLQSVPRPGWVPFTGQAAPVRTPALVSAREQEVLRLVAEGLTDAQVARRLGLSPRTISKHLERVYARLGVPNRAAAVNRWFELSVDNSL